MKNEDGRKMDINILYVLKKLKKISLDLINEDAIVEYRTLEYPDFTKSEFGYPEEQSVIDLLIRNGVVSESEPGGVVITSDRNPYLQQNIYYFRIDKQKFLKLYKNTKRRVEKNDFSTDKVLVCKDLILNIKSATLQWIKNEPITITPENQEIKLLTILMKNKNEVVQYTRIAKKLNLNCYREGVLNKDVAREVQDIKKELNKNLYEAGLKKKDINDMIIAIRGSGYKLVCK